MNTMLASDLPLPRIGRGKVRDIYAVGDDRVLLLTTDRISAFDVVLGTIPLKGQVLNRMAAYWFEETREVAPNHVIAVPDPQVMVAVACALPPALALWATMRAIDPS